MKPKIFVVAGVLINSDGHILITERPDDKSWAGYWEFPGGKIEPNETPTQALLRELKEEINLLIKDPQPLLTLNHEYDTYQVELMVFTIREWAGEEKGLENQQIQWVDMNTARQHPRLLPTTLSILNALETSLQH